MVTDLLIRASYPNYYMVKKYAESGREIFNKNVDDKDNLLKGNKPGTVIYKLEGDPEGVTHEFPPRWYDMYYLMRQRGEKQRKYLEMLIAESTEGPIEELEDIRNNFKAKCQKYVIDNPLYNSDEIITTLAEAISPTNKLATKVACYSTSHATATPCLTSASLPPRLSTTRKGLSICLKKRYTTSKS